MRWWATKDKYWGRAIWRGPEPMFRLSDRAFHQVEPGTAVTSGGPWVSDAGGQKYVLDVIWPLGLGLGAMDVAEVEVIPLRKIG